MGRGSNVTGLGLRAKWVELQSEFYAARTLLVQVFCVVYWYFCRGKFQLQFNLSLSLCLTESSLWRLSNINEAHISILSFMNAKKNIYSKLRSFERKSFLLPLPIDPNEYRYRLYFGCDDRKSPITHFVIFMMSSSFIKIFGPKLNIKYF